PVLELHDVAVAYGKRRALEGVSLSVGPGEIVTLLGANGAGKSTTLRAVSGLVRPTRGRILYEGRDITHVSADATVAAGVSHVPEGREIFPEFTVRENLLVGGHTVERSRIDERLESVCRLFPVLRERQAQTAGTLSGGEQQMLAIGRALMTRPRLLLLDEPSLGLAPMLAREVFRVIRRVNEAGVGGVLAEPAWARRLPGVRPEDIARVEDWRRLPFLTKEELRDAYPYGLACARPAGYRRIQMSSGTTGNPILNPYTASDVAQWGEVMARCYVAAGVGPTDVIQITPSFGLFTGGFGFHYGAERLGAMVIPTGAGRTGLQLRLMRDLQATVVTAIATYPLRLIEAAREERFDLGSLSLRVGILGS